MGSTAARKILIPLVACFSPSPQNAEGNEKNFTQENYFESLVRRKKNKQQTLNHNFLNEIKNCAN